jgi:FKBP-type peptidyl-prolyl cis-trans isomerase
MNKSPISLLVIFFTAIFIGCNDPETFNPVDQLNQEIAAIDSYLAANNLTAVKHVSGIRVVIDSLGGGLPVSIYTDPKVEVRYKGILFSGGSIFAPEATAKNRELSGYIPGWQVVLPMLPEGTKATAYIPSYYGYGRSQQGPIPPNSTLVFEMEFIDNPKTSAQIAQFDKDTAAVHKFLTDNAISATYDSLGIWYAITDSTEGPTPGWYDQVHVKYELSILGDTTSLGTFDQKPEPGSFDSRVVDYLNGIQIGLQRMTEGSKATFYVPSGLAFAGQPLKNSSGVTVLQANTNIVVEMELIDIIE